MEPVTKKSPFPLLLKCFHVLHLCVTIGLVIAVVHNQLANNARFDQLEHQKSRLQAERSNTKLDEGPSTKSRLRDPHSVVRRDASVTLKQRIKVNSTTLESEFINDSYSLKGKKVVEDSKKHALMCLDMLRIFIKNNTSEAIDRNVCEQLKGPKGDRGQPGERGEIGPRGCPGESFAAPQFHSSPYNVVYTEREAATMLCNATSNPFSHITWYRDNVRIRDGSRYAVIENVTVPSVLRSNNVFCGTNRHPFTQSSLVIKQSRANDTGKYFCEARNLVGFLRREITLLIQVYVEFTTDPPSTITVVEKDNVKLSCRASGVPPPLITWHRKDYRPMPSVFRVAMGDLHISNITKKDEGVYECVATNVLGSNTREAAITVNVFPEISHFREVQTTVNESQSLHLPCNATGFPAPAINWYKTNGSLPSDRYTYNSHRLAISNVKYEDGGEYVCTANNTLGAVSRRTRVVVQAAPKILKSPDVTEFGYKGYNKTIAFTVFAFPAASIKWFKNGKNMDRFRLQSYSLLLPNVQYHDSGLYQALAWNILGEVRVTTFLIVRDPVPPAIISTMNQTVQYYCAGDHLPMKKCSALGNPIPKIIWKHDGIIIPSSEISGSLTLNISTLMPHHSGQYTCEASNRFGKADLHFNLEVADNISVQTSCSYQRIDCSSGKIKSPGHPRKYGNSLNCWWLMESIGGRISLSFESFNTEKKYDKVEVFDGASTNSSLSLGIFSGSSRPHSITSSSSQLYITFKTDGSTVGNGFSIKYQPAD